MKKMYVALLGLGLIGASVGAGEPCHPTDASAGSGGTDKKCTVAPGQEMTCKDGKCAITAQGRKDGIASAEGTLSVEGLAALIRAKVPLLIFDARSGKFDDGRRIPGAKALNAASTPAEVQAAIPDKSALIVTYCGGLKCPASHQLAERLKKDGFNNVVELPEGIEGWVKAGHAADEVKR